MEDLIIGLLFVYFFVIRPIIKQARARKGKQTASHRPAARQRTPLVLLLEKLKQKLQEAAEQAEGARRGEADGGPQTSWKDLFAEDTWTPPPEAPGRPPDAGTEPPVWAVAEEGPGLHAPEDEVLATLAAEAAAIGMPETPDHPRAGGVPPHRERSIRSRPDLRQAVVWSEILGPPVSLRGTD